MLQSREIEQLNAANLVLRHFVDLSAQLLPFLNDLHQKRNLSKIESDSMKKIISVFENYQFDTKTSESLINSNVLALIKKTYEKITSAHLFDKRQSFKTLNDFMFEHQRLVESWNYVDSN